jgi:hypothetical protein
MESKLPAKRAQRCKERIDKWCKCAVSRKGNQYGWMEMIASQVRAEGCSAHPSEDGF